MNVTDVDWLFALIVPFSVAPVVVILDAAFVVAAGGELTVIVDVVTATPSTVICALPLPEELFAL